MNERVKENGRPEPNATDPETAAQPLSAGRHSHRARTGKLKLPRFRGVLGRLGNYVSVVTVSIVASYAIGER